MGHLRLVLLLLATGSPAVARVNEDPSKIARAGEVAVSVSTNGHLAADAEDAGLETLPSSAFPDLRPDGHMHGEHDLQGPTSFDDGKAREALREKRMICLVCLFSLLIAPLVMTFQAGSGSSASDSERPPSMVQDLSKSWKLVLASLSVLALGITVGKFGAGWDTITCLYFIAQVVTTVGYGDIGVEKNWMEVFMAFYILLCLLVLANLMSLVVDGLLERRVQDMEERLKRHESIGAFGDKSPLLWEVLTAVTPLVISILVGTLFFRMELELSDDGCDTYGRRRCSDMRSWSFAFYASIVSVTSVGFGDYTPKSSSGRLFLTFWIIWGVATAGFFITRMSSLLNAEEEADIESESATSIDQELFASIDTDCNGYLTRLEYTQYMLVKYGFVTHATLRQVDEKYDVMDTSKSGAVTWEMVKDAAKRLRHSAPSPST